MALCSESTGTIWSGREAALDEGPADDERLLVGEGRDRPPPPSAARAGSQADRPRDAVEHDVGATAGGDRRRVVTDDDLGARGRAPAGRGRRATAAHVLDLSPGRGTRGTSCSTACRARRLTFLPAERAATVKRPLRAMTSRAWVPMEPVEPRTATEREVTSPLSALGLPDVKRECGGSRHVVKMRSSMRRSLTTWACGWKRPCSKSFCTSSSTCP